MTKFKCKNLCSFIQIFFLVVFTLRGLDCPGHFYTACIDLLLKKSSVLRYQILKLKAIEFFFTKSQAIVYSFNNDNDKELYPHD